MAEEDVIFGKHRHLFGGMEPSNMNIFSAISATDAGISLKCVLPDPTVIENQKICSVGGAVIRRRADTYPVDEFDGDLVADISESGKVLDVVGDITQTYYYAAFPYSTQGVYNRNDANCFKYVYDPCDALVSFTATNGPGGVTINGSFTGTDIIGGVICRSTTGYPSDESEGTVAGTWDNSSKSFSIVDADIVRGNTYYYTAFPNNSAGFINYAESNRASVEIPSYTYLYGFDLVNSDSNPATRVTYPSDVDNANYTAALMNFDTDKFSYGSWPSTPGEKFMPRPCMLKYDGTVDYYLDPDDYTKKEDGTSSDVSDTSYGGNAMMEWPKIYTKRWEENGIYHFRCSDIKVDEDYECWCNYDRLDNEIPHFYTAIYHGCNETSKLRSLSSYPSYTYETISNHINRATANGDDWYIEVVADRFLIQDLLVMMFKNTNIQSVLGRGAVEGNESASGKLDQAGLFWGSNVNTNGIKVFGMENLWGNVDRRVAGWILSSYYHNIKITRGTKDGSTATDYNTTGDGYISTNIYVPQTSNYGSYISNMTTKTYGRLPRLLSGSSTTYEADAIVAPETGGPYYANFGGHRFSDYKNSTGPFFVNFTDLDGYEVSSITAALSCKPLASIQNS